MVCTGFHGENACPLQTGLRAGGLHGRGELDKSLLGLADGGEGRNAATHSGLLLLTCREYTAFLFHFHGTPEMLKQRKCVSEVFLADFCSVPLATCNKSLWDS